MTNLRGNRDRETRHTVVDEPEMRQLLAQAGQEQDEFLRLRNRAILCVLRKTGKRRGEVAPLQNRDRRVENGQIKVTFTLEKKRKGKGHITVSEKGIRLTDPLAGPILEYFDYLDKMNPPPKYLFPPQRQVFGISYGPDVEDHIKPRQLFNVIRGLSEQVWPHLFRDSAGADEVKKHKDGILAVYAVLKRLDLEKEETGFRYLRRWATDVIEHQEEEEHEGKTPL